LDIYYFHRAYASRISANGTVIHNGHPHRITSIGSNVYSTVNLRSPVSGNDCGSRIALPRVLVNKECCPVVYEEIPMPRSIYNAPYLRNWRLIRLHAMGRSNIYTMCNPLLAVGSICLLLLSSLQAAKVFTRDHYLTLCFSFLALFGH
jgi:hypothetical protein